MEAKRIIIQGARQHNLKNINLVLPKDALIVITGLSGSGKSTLAFDTLYAEGQRRYVESLSTYARQFLERLEKPDVDLIEGLSPSIAIEQQSGSHNPRSTVGTVTEIYDYLRLLFARVGTPHCHQCGRPITAQTIDQILDQTLGLAAGTRIYILAPIHFEQTSPPAKTLRRLRKEGFARVRLNGDIIEIEKIPKQAVGEVRTLEVVVDRLVVKPKIRNRLADSLELAAGLSGGRAVIEVVGENHPIYFTEKPVCVHCGVAYPELTPGSFSFNSPHGACPRCSGLGTRPAFDPERIVPNPELSLREGAVAPWAHRHSVQFTEFLDALCRHYQVDLYTPYKDLPSSFKNVLLYGSGEEKITFYFERGGRRFTYQRTFEGIIPKLRRRYMENESNTAREDVRSFMNFLPCPACAGTRLNPVSRSVTIKGHSITAVTCFAVKQALDFFQHLDLDDKKKNIARRIVKEIVDRLGFMMDVGLGYLTLDRSANTLSGGESQRIRLATQIGSKLTGVLYVLDEPSIGLHQRDNRRLLSTLFKMRDLGNTVVVVEHDENTIRRADHVVDMGPLAGMHGGEVVFSGPPAEIIHQEDSLTGGYLSGRLKIAVPPRRRPTAGAAIAIRGAHANNLKHIQVSFPLGCFIGVTGVSGSGKSSLILKTLYPALSQQLYHTRVRSGAYTDISGLDRIDKVIHIDQSAIGKTPRSNPATYTGVFTHIRDLFARTPDARARGYKAGRFSFNVKGGRCEACAGDGIIKIEMHFLPDVYVVCDVCGGKRYNRETREIRYKGKNIADVLGMTVNQAHDFFFNVGNIRKKLETLTAVGMGYIRLGQSATTLSGGEAQRLKLSKALSRKDTGKTVYILDEPTTGLHSHDIQQLIHVLNQLVDAGNTVIVIEHNLDVIKTTDYIIDLGPEGGDEGGYVVASGTPEEIAAAAGSFTGQYLQKMIGG